jgi:hypothetical protein
MGTFGATVSVAPGNSAIAHTDLQAAASSATVLLAPLTYSGSAARVVLFHPNVVSFSVRARGDFSALTTSPVVCIYYLYAANGNVTVSPGDTNIPDAGTLLTNRALNPSGTYTHTLDCTVATADKDSFYKYSPLVLSTSGYGTTYGSASTDIIATRMLNRMSALGVIVLTSTAGNVSGGTDVLEAQVMAY